MKLRVYQSGGVFKRFNFNNLHANSQEDIKELQRELGVVDDGIIGGKTIKALQKRVGANVDGAWGKNSKEATSSYIQSLQTKPEEASKEKSRWKLFSLKEKQEQPEVEKEEQKATAWTPSSVEGSVQNNKAYSYDIKTKSWVPTEECALWANDSLRRFKNNKGKNIYTSDNIGGDAWTRLTAGKNKMIYSGYDSEEYDRRGYSEKNSNKRNHDASNKLRKEFNSDVLDKSKVYLVNMYYDRSPHKQTAWKEGASGVTGTHTGNLYWDEGSNSWKVAHNIHGKILNEDFISLQGDRTGKGYGVTAIAEAATIKSPFWHKAKALLNTAAKEMVKAKDLKMKNGGSLTLKWQNGSINKPIYLPEIYVSPNKAKTQFINGFNDFRDEAKTEYGISDREYDDLLTNATAIAELESGFGNGLRYKAKSIIPNAALNTTKLILKGQNVAKNGLSKGLTQIKYKYDVENNPELSKDYNKYGITEKSLEDPRVSAKATAIRLIHGKKHLQDSTYNYSDGTEIPENTKLAMWWHAGDNAFPSNGIVDSLGNYTKKFNSLINQQ